MCRKITSFDIALENHFNCSGGALLLENHRYGMEHEIIITVSKRELLSSSLHAVALYKYSSEPQVM